MKRISIQVIGRVQGVWFRKYTCDIAQALELNGIVKNQVDGSVYIEASGPDEKVDELVNWCWSGSPLSHVDQVLVHDIDNEHKNSFAIKS